MPEPDVRRRRPLLVRLFSGWRGYLVRQWPLLLVLACLIVGLALVVTGHWRRGAMVIGGTIGLAGLLRLLLPEDVVGLLVVRSRWVDVLVTGVAGAAMIVMAVIVPAV